MRARLPPAARRQQILDVARGLLNEHGAPGVEIVRVAELAGVTRPVVYRFFPSRLALLQGVLDDFEAALSARFERAFVDARDRSILEITDAFIEACCDVIEEKGKGAWHLMYARSPDLEAARLGGPVHQRLLAPWLPRVAELTGVAPERIVLLGDILVAAGRAALDGWLEGPLDRAEAVEATSRTVAAVLREFIRA